MKTRFIILFLLSFTLTAFSQGLQDVQTIVGTVIDKSTHKPLEGANITLHGSPKIIAVSDINGNYKFEKAPIGKVRIEASFLGYESIIVKNFTLTAEKELVVNFELESNTVNLKEVVITGKAMSFKKMGLYDNDDEKEVKNIDGFYALNIFNDEVTDEIWGLGKTNFINFGISKTVAYKGTSSLDLEWDKLSDNNKWLGMGFGWDGWSGKNVEQIEDKAAIQFYVRTAKGKMKNLVLIFILEDYGGHSCVAVLKDLNYMENKILDEKWNKVTIPFSEFKIDREKCDMSNIKQLTIQFEVKGHIFIDEIEIVDYKTNQKHS